MTKTNLCRTVLTFVFFLGILHTYLAPNPTYALSCGGSGNCHSQDYDCRIGGINGGSCYDGDPGCICGYFQGAVNGTVACKSYDGYTCDPAACGGSSLPGDSDCYPYNPYSQTTYYSEGDYYSQGTYYSEGYYYSQNSYYSQGTYYSEGEYYAQGSYPPGYSENNYYSQNGYYSESTYGYTQNGYYAESTYGQPPPSCPTEGATLSQYCEESQSASCAYHTTVTQKSVFDANAPGYCGSTYECGGPCGGGYSEGSYPPGYTQGTYPTSCYGTPSTPSCGASFKATAIDTTTGTSRTINSVAYTGTSGGQNIGATSTINVKPNETVRFDYNPDQALPTGSCQLGQRATFNVYHIADATNTNAILTCHEFPGLRTYYCDNLSAKVAFVAKASQIKKWDGSAGTDASPGQYIPGDDLWGAPNLGNIKPQQGCYKQNANTIYCSQCNNNGTIQYGNPYLIDNNMEGNPYYNENGDLIYTPIPVTETVKHINHRGDGDEDVPMNNMCKAAVDSFANDPATPIPYETAAKDNVAKKQFQNPGTYRVEYRTHRAGPNGGAMDNNPCVVKVVVANPNPPTGTLVTDAAQNTCIIQEGQTTCNLNVTWTTADTDTLKITYREGGTQFLGENINQLNGTAAAAANPTTRTFDLYGKSASFPTYYDNGPLATVAFHGNPYINGNVYIDTNENGFQDVGEAAYTGGGVVLINGGQNNLDASGHFLHLNLAPTANPTGYTVSYTAPAGYEITTPSSRSFSLSAPTRVDFGIAPLHTVSGKLFNDQNKNKIFDGGDSAYTTQATIQAAKTDGTIIATVTTDGNGDYTLSNLPSGITNISLLSPVPTGFRVIWPVGSTPPAYSAQVGPACGSGPLDNTTGASYINTQQCNVQGLNFAISNSIPWLQMMGSDGRFDTGANNGQFTNFVANSLACNSGYTLLPGANSVPGVALIGSSSRDTAFGGVGVGSSNNWILGYPFPEYFTTFGSNPSASGQGLQTSYDYVLNTATTSNITPTNFTSIVGCTDLNNCSISAVTANGIFKANGSVVLNGATFGSGKNYILLINGDLTIKGNIIVPTGSTATFAVKGDIIIDKSVGTSSFTCPTIATSGQIQGFFSADKSIIIDSKDPTGSGANCSDGTGADLQLNVDGSLVANAGLNSGGFENRRDLCAYNITYPVLTLKERLDFMLNAPELLKTQNYIYREVAP